MSDNIVKPVFGKPTKPEEPPERLIFVCQCGCRTFNMYADGNIVCSYCDGELGPGQGSSEGWRRCLPDVPDVVEQDEGGTVNDHQLPDESLARRHIMKRINKLNEEGELALVYAYSTDGGGHGWMGFDTEEQREWTIRKMKEVIQWARDYRLGDGSDTGAKVEEGSRGLPEDSGIQGEDEAGLGGTAEATPTED